MKKSPGYEKRRSSRQETNDVDGTNEGDVTREENEERKQEDNNNSGEIEKRKSTQAQRRARKRKEMDEHKSSGASMEAAADAAANNGAAATNPDQRRARKLRQMNNQETADSTVGCSGDNVQQEGADAAAAPGDDMAVSRKREGDTLVGVERAVTHGSETEQEFSKVLGVGAVAGGAAAAASRDVSKSMPDVEAPNISSGVDDDGVQRPGAYSAPGRAFGAFPAWGRARGEPSRSSSRSRSRMYDRVSARFGLSRREPSALQVNAVLVEEGEDQQRSSSIPSSSQGGFAADTPIVEATRIESEEKLRKRWCFMFLLAVLVVIAIAVAVVVPLSVSDSSSSDDGERSGDRPSPTMAPVFESTNVTALLQLDGRPFETGWSLECGDETIFKIPPGTYSIGTENRLVTIDKAAPVGPDCVLFVEDAGGDGIESGRVELYHGGNILDKTFLIQGGDGNFTNSKSFSFVIDPPPVADTPAPTPAVSVEDPVLITIEVQLDRFPTETGWVLVCGERTLANVPPLTYTTPNGMINPSFEVERGSSCLCSLTDTFDDGICCGLGEGSYNIFFSDDNNEKVLLAAGGNFGRDISIPFTASPPPATINVNVKVALFANAPRTNWTLVCDGLVLEEVPTGTYVQDAQNDTRSYTVDEGVNCEFHIVNNAFLEDVNEGEELAEDYFDDIEPSGDFLISLGADSWVVVEGRVFSSVTVPFCASRRFLRPGIAVDVEILLDSDPMQNGWSLICGDFLNRMVPTGTYTQDFQYIWESFIVADLTECVFRIEDDGGDGFEDSGFYTVFVSSVTTEPETDVVVVATEGHFGSAREFHSSMTTGFRAITISPPPRVTVNVEIGLGMHPAEIGWNLTCARGSISRVAPVGTYTSTSSPIIRETFLMRDNVDCVFVIQDAGGDGLIGDQYYVVGYGDGERAEVFFTPAATGNSGDGPFDEKMASFTASLRRPPPDGPPPPP